MRNIDFVKDLGFASLFYSVYISHIDLFLVNKYIILTEKEVNTGYINRVKDLGFASVFYEVDISCIDRFRGQYYIYRVFPQDIAPGLPLSQLKMALYILSLCIYNGYNMVRAVLFF